MLNIRDVIALPKLRARIDIGFLDQEKKIKMVGVEEAISVSFGR
jgi:hypothetical protein